LKSREWSITSETERSQRLRTAITAKLIEFGGFAELLRHLRLSYSLFAIGDKK